MENKYHNIDEIFRNSLDNYSADPPAHVWENIDSALDKMDGKRKSRFMWFMGSFLAIATTFVGGYYLSGYLAGNTREIAAPENSMIKIRTVLLVDATIDADKMKMKLGEKMSLISGMQNSVVNNDGNDLTQPVSNNSITNVNLNSRTGSTRNNGHTTVTRGGARHNNGNSILPGQDYSVRDQGGVHSSSVTPSTNLGQQNIIRNDKGYFGSSNVTHDNSTKPVTTEPADSLKKNGQLNGSSSKPQSYYVDPKSLNDAQKLALAKENKEENVETPVAKNDNFTGSPVNITGNENNVKEEDLSYLSPSYPIITVLPYFAPMYTFQNSSNDDNAYSPVFGSNGNFDEKPTFSWSSGVMLGYNFTERLTVFIGCGYNQFSTVTSRSSLQTVPLNQWMADTSGEVYTSAGRVDGMDLINPVNEGTEPYFVPEQGMSGPITRMTQTFGFVEVPVLVRYKFFGERVGMTLTGGLSTGFLVRNEVFAENETERVSVGRTADIRNFNLNAQLGVGLEVKILPWLFFDFEPTIRYSFLNWSTDPKVKMNPLFFSANTGLAFKF